MPQCAVSGKHHKGTELGRCTACSKLVCIHHRALHVYRGHRPAERAGVRFTQTEEVTG